ncbi:hypothetical protein SAMN04488082_13016 [Desulfomicrobium apsheronum]|uniref:Uncharacterized protein n=1 Tax=Desulfomicrobium apsheronum TaxID=52560 RepID=A0A1I4A874_9BACT|nr:hypothetical protein SAMN04488082_13016 [Desulfomicrobium apsheronum]
MFVKRAFRGAFFFGLFVEDEEGGGRAVAIRSAPVKTRRNSFAGLVMLSRCVVAREVEAGRLATIQQTMPGSIRQSAGLDRDEPDRLVRCVGRLLVGFGRANWWWNFLEDEEGGGRAAAIRSAPVKTRRNSFAGLVILNRCVVARKAVAGRLATIQQTMPGSIRQSARLDRDEPDRLVRCVDGFWWGLERRVGGVCKSSGVVLL